jgi:uncharacterized Zn-finger protein
MFMGFTGFVEEIGSTSGGKRFQCSQCNKFYANRTNVLRHQRDAHTGAAERPTCGTCNRVFKNMSTLRSHIDVNHIPFACPICKYALKNKVSLRTHISQYHRKK